MSVQNPERVVTKQDLADFYGEILPYLGGMPDILANKFSKGDMYSTDEKMIGQWIDGKPLYSKCITKTVSKTSGSWADFETLSGVSTIFFDGYGTDGSQNYPIPYSSGTAYISFRYESGKIQYITSDSNWVDNNSITLNIKYTKTSDSAVSIGNDTDYSTTEKIVGTWIDGRPIWQKTVSGTMPAAGSDTKISVSSDTIDFALTCKGTVPTYRTQPLSDYLGTSASTLFLIMTFFDAEEQKVYLRNTGVPASQGKTAYVTVTYVKAT